MITDGGAKKFEPRSLAVSVGDTVRFVNVSGNHNTQSVDSMIPEGVTPWLSDIGEEFEVLVTEEGIFGYICTPHLENGMVGLFYTEDAAANFTEAEAATATLPDRPWLIFDILLEPFRS